MSNNIYQQKSLAQLKRSYPEDYEELETSILRGEEKDINEAMILMEKYFKAMRYDVNTPMFRSFITTVYAAGKLAYLSSKIRKESWVETKNAILKSSTENMLTK